MSAFIVRQPNGKLCRFSSVCDCPSDWNMTDKEYIEMRIKKAQKEAEEDLKELRTPFSMVKDNFLPNNMSKNQFNRVLKSMSDPKGKRNHY